MPLVEVNDLDRFGVLRDLPPYQLPPEAWSLGNNMRVQDGGVERLEGRAQVFGTPGVAPHFTMPVASSSQVYWIYTSLTKAYVYDGTTHTDITRAAGDYTAGTTRDWNGTLLAAVPILNNGSDVPQYWASINPATDLAALPNWNANHRAKVIRAFGPYLVALNVTKSGVNFAHMVKWSHPADPGTVPVSWDETDPTRDAGEYDLPDGAHAGVIIDGGTLRDKFFIYKEGSIWRVSLTGTSAIFDFDLFLESTGILAPRCFAYTVDGMQHVFATQDDLLIHNGNSAESILSKKMRRTLFNQISVANYRNCFMFTNPYRDEVWFCYPEAGNSQPNRALIWNYKQGEKGGITEADVNFRYAASGTIESPTTDTWTSVSGTWTSYIGAWSTANRRKTLLCATDTTKFLQLDVGVTNDGAAFTATLQREGLSVEGRKRNGDWIVDYASQKLVTRIWPKIEGGPVNIRIGFQEKVDGPVSWAVAQSFNPVTQLFLDFAGAGKAIAVEFATSDSVPWKVVGYKLDLKVVSRY